MKNSGMQEISETLGATLERQAAAFPRKDFIVFPDRNLRFSYSSFDPA
jgi:fatty-acyl-CoA synthase